MSLIHPDTAKIRFGCTVIEPETDRWHPSNANYSVTTASLSDDGKGGVVDFTALDGRK